MSRFTVGFRFLFEKELNISDLNSTGRIILPKEVAISDFPKFDSRKCIPLVMRDFDKHFPPWEFKFRFWRNRDSKMFILENTGKFVECHNLILRDFIIFYKDDDTNEYIIRGRKNDIDKELQHDAHSQQKQIKKARLELGYNPSRSVSNSSQQEALNQRDKLKKEVDSLKSELQQVTVDRDRQMVITHELQVRNAYLESQFVEEKKLQKELHNIILELKGNIRVFYRVRSALPDIGSKGADSIVVSYPTSIEYVGHDIDLVHNAQKLSLIFDKVFGFEANQKDAFIEIPQLVQSALDGYKVCIFAYGHTGSGKTYTMMDNPEYHEHKGLIPRFLEQIFEASQASQGWKYKMQASMLEIYNETITDLLSSSRCSSSTTHINKQFTLQRDLGGNTHVSNFTVVDVCNINEASFYLKQAVQSRSVGKTQMNEESSRSHFVISLHISGMNDVTKQHVRGVLNLIDLAGSERLPKSGSTSDHETMIINNGLSFSRDVTCNFQPE